MPYANNLLPLGARKARGLVYDMLPLSFDSSGFPGLSLLNGEVGVGGEGVCTGCFSESLSALMIKGNSGTSFPLCVPVYVSGNTVSHTV